MCCHAVEVFYVFCVFADSVTQALHVFFRVLTNVCYSALKVVLLLLRIVNTPFDPSKIVLCFGLEICEVFYQSEFLVRFLSQVVTE